MSAQKMCIRDSSVTATKLSLKLADYVVTEAGFGADLGAEKFLDIKCRMADLHPSAVVLEMCIRDRPRELKSKLTNAVWMTEYMPASASGT